MRVLGLIGYGIVLGLTVAAVQLGLVGAGAIANDQLPRLFAYFAGAGVVLALGGDALAGLILRRRDGSFAAGLLVPALMLTASVPFNLRGRPDVYLIVTDTTRADHLSLYGYERATSPFLERLSQEAVVFTNAVSQASHTLVTMSSLFTSRYPSEHGMSRYSDVMPDDLPMLAEHLEEAGYQTYGFVTNPHLGADRGFGRGFGDYVHAGSWRHASAVQINDRFLDWLEASADGRSLFAFLFYVDPHSPYKPPAPFSEMFEENPEAEPVQKWPRKQAAPSPDSEQLHSLVAQYDGAIAYWDAAFAKLIDELKTRGAFENALLIYTSDHGEEFFEHGYWGHNRSLFEEAIRVPLLVSVPSPLRLPPMPRRTGRLADVASSVDILPTILDAAGIAPDPGARGQSLIPLVRGVEETGVERIAYTEEILNSYGPYDVRGIRTRDHKYVQVFKTDDAAGPRELFFDLRADPEEKRNLLGSNDAEVERLRRLFEEMTAEMERVAPPQNESVQLNRRRLEALKALGYVGDE